jgi:hypothetical protein
VTQAGASARPKKRNKDMQPPTRILPTGGSHIRRAGLMITKTCTGSPSARPSNVG